MRIPAHLVIRDNQPLNTTVSNPRVIPKADIIRSDDVLCGSHPSLWLVKNPVVFIVPAQVLRHIERFTVQESGSDPDTRGPQRTLFGQPTAVFHNATCD